MKKFLSIAMLACAVSFAEAAVDAKPLRLGPVSVYGALGTSGKKIVSQKTGQQVMLRGMSLFWSDATGTPYYNSEVIGWAADRLGIDVFRFAMGIDCYNSDGGGCTKDDTKSGAIASNVAYKYNPTGKEAQLDNMVKAAATAPKANRAWQRISLAVCPQSTRMSRTSFGKYTTNP